MVTGDCRVAYAPRNDTVVVTQAYRIATINNNLPQKGRFMFCTIIDIRGDYAFVKYDDTGIVSDVALALLPFGADVGDRLVFENFEFSKA